MNEDTSDKPLKALTSTGQRVGMAADHGGEALVDKVVANLGDVLDQVG